MEKEIKAFSKMLAKEISHRKIMDIDAVATLIETNLQASFMWLIAEYSVTVDNHYSDIKDKARKAYGTKKYLEIGLELSTLKNKKATANRAANNMKREDGYAKLTQWVKETYGQDALDKFIESTPSFSEHPKLYHQQKPNP